MSLSFFLKRRARALFVVESSLATSFLSSFFFYCLGMLGGYSNSDGLQFDWSWKLVGIFSFEVTPMNMLGDKESPTKLM
jgi:hypothetical protein